MADAEELPGGEPEGGKGDDDLWPGPTVDKPTEPTGEKGDGEGIQKWPGPTVDGE